ncbi:hypothetical protein EV13_0011 [Prochlorococcus sp. MIT 0702]|nr:hypothetical protein EV13_0011 [Prochlorococcus sp. MIT 0702]
MLLLLERLQGHSAKAHLSENALAGQKFGTEADDDAHHGETAVPCFCEVNEAETGLSFVGHV